MTGIRASVVPTPNKPDNNPMMKVSAEKIDEILRFDAPIALKMPISLVLSRTYIRVMTAIMIEDTTREIDTKATST